jgi:uncharacterized RDD family membrane protein YckC
MERLGLGLRRAGAYGVDCAVIMLYAAVLLVITLLAAPDAELSRLQGYGLALATLTGPVVIGFSALEARYGATVGKLLFGLQVRRGRMRPGFGRALVRNVGKFLPWEIAHIGIWTISGQPFIDPPGDLNLALWAVSYSLLALQIVLVLLFKAGLHDWAAGLRVQLREPS